jgi:hypothetical protein
MPSGAVSWRTRSRGVRVAGHHAAGFALLDRGTAAVSQEFFARVVEVQVLVLIDIYAGKDGGLASVVVDPGDLLIMDTDDNVVVCVPKMFRKGRFGGSFSRPRS